MLVFLDMEMTGLIPEKDLILEVGLVLTDDYLGIIDKQDWVVKQDVDFDKVDPFVIKMHTDNGLWDDLKDGYELGAVEADAISWLEDRHAANSRWLAAGSSVHFDKSFMRKHMPTLDKRFHYRIVDTSTVGELVRRWIPDAFYARAEEQPAHRALADCLGSIEELKYYKNLLIR